MVWMLVVLVGEELVPPDSPLTSMLMGGSFMSTGISVRSAAEYLSAKK
jgi:hypothetical protein